MTDGPHRCCQANENWSFWSSDWTSNEKIQKSWRSDMLANLKAWLSILKHRFTYCLLLRVKSVRIMLIKIYNRIQIAYFLWLKKERIRAVWKLFRSNGRSSCEWVGLHETRAAGVGWCSIPKESVEIVLGFTWQPHHPCRLPTATNPTASGSERATTEQVATANKTRRANKARSN